METVIPFGKVKSQFDPSGVHRTGQETDSYRHHFWRNKDNRGLNAAHRAVRMYAVVLACILAPLLVPGTSSAATGDMTIGGKLGFATSPAPGTGVGIGAIFGSFAYQFLDNIPSRGNDGLEGVGEIGFFSWSGDGGTINNVPLFFLARYFYTVAPALRAYGDAGLSLNFWSAPGASETDAGFATGVGVEYLFTPEMGVGGEMRLNVVRPSWWDADHVLFLALFNYHILAPQSAVTRREFPRRRR